MSAGAQENGPVPAVVVIDGSPAPIAPETITRDARGRATVRAFKLREPLRLDGKLDEEIYGTVQPFGGLLQVAPDYGAPATERTDVWVTYDDDNIYVSAKCWDSTPPEHWINNELRRDAAGIRDNDHFGVMFDTFYDRRSGFLFYTNPLGALSDYSIVDEGSVNRDWNPVWTSHTGDLRGRLERRDGDPVQVAALPFRRQPDLGLPAAPRDPPQERVGLSDAGAAEPLPDRRRSTASRRAARWSASICRRRARTSSSSRTPARA